MTTRHIEQECRDFSAYLTEIRKWSQTTSVRQTYSLRAALYTLIDMTDPTEVELYHASLSFTQRRAFRSVWRLLHQFRQHRGILPLPAPAPIGRPGRPTVQERCSLPNSVTVALAALVEDKIPPKAIAHMTWGDVLGEGTSIRLRAVLDRKGVPKIAGVERSYSPLSLRGRAALDDLRIWASGDAGVDPHEALPLVPMLPLSHIGATAGLIRRAAQDVRAGLIK